METTETFYLKVELKPHYLTEFVIYGIPVPLYKSTSTGFSLNFENTECYSNYISLLKLILNDLVSADPQDCKYDIQRSKAFINNVLMIIRTCFLEKYN